MGVELNGWTWPEADGPLSAETRARAGINNGRVLAQRRQRPFAARGPPGHLEAGL